MNQIPLISMIPKQSEPLKIWLGANIKNKMGRHFSFEILELELQVIKCVCFYVSMCVSVGKGGEWGRKLANK